MAATKLVKPAALGAQHTAGIYSDMTVDGPIIGTLVTIIDRAKNLPNRRSMGKQDPYCAARLGKEAKKTATDRRGGQTPRWYAAYTIIRAGAGTDMTQGPGTPIHRARLGRLPPAQGVRVQRRQEDGADWRDVGQSRGRHHPGRRPERHLARPELQGKIRRGDPHRAHLLRHAPQGGEGIAREKTADRTSGYQPSSRGTTREHACQAEAAALGPYRRLAFASEHARAARVAWSAGRSA